MGAVASDVGRGGRRAGAGKPAGTVAVPVSVRERLVLAKAEREEHQARLAALEVAERERRLVDAEEAIRSSRRAGMAIRDAVLSIPGKLAAELVGLDEIAIERRLTAAIREELTRIARQVTDDAA